MVRIPDDEIRADLGGVVEGNIEGGEDPAASIRGHHVRERAPRIDPDAISQGPVLLILFRSRDFLPGTAFTLPQNRLVRKIEKMNISPHLTILSFFSSVPF